MGNINRFLLMVIAMVGIMIAAVGIDIGVKHYNDQKWEKERVARYEQAYADVADIQMTISQLAQDKEAIEAFIEENKEYFDGAAEFGDEFAGAAEDVRPDSSALQENIVETSGSMEGGESENEHGENLLDSEDGTDAGYDVSGNQPEESFGVSGNEAEGSGGGDDAVSGNQTHGSSDVSENDPDGNDTLLENQPDGSHGVSENELDGNASISGNEAGGSHDISGNGLDGKGTVSGNQPDVSQSISGNGLGGISGNELGADGLEGGVSANGQEKVYDVSGNSTEFLSATAGNTLQEKRKIRGSYMETQIQNKIDLDVISNNSFDFSQVSITCLGDSITAGTNLDSMENYQQHAYPARLKELLGAQSVTNLGIGGSSIGRYWDNAFVDRFKEIPADTDLIVVMGGTNDGFCMSQEELGTMQERKAGTFIGDLDELMRGLKENYPAAEIVFVTPLPNVLHDMLRKERDYLLPQNTLVNVIIQLATEYDIQVIDLYNSNMLDTHDAAVIYNYMPDGVHCNADGYSVLAEHLAAELIRIYGGVEIQPGSWPDAQNTPEVSGDMQEQEEEPEAEGEPGGSQEPGTQDRDSQEQDDGQGV
ncbi:MAG: hypothetical protein K2O16_20930 [Lachnospiraceae bacterium]|nr:hypothetical protein [Lachnospiraceae bacterium]